MSVYDTILNELDVINFCEENIRPLVEGAQLTRHGILSIGRTNSNEEIPDPHIFALVMQASHSSELPYEVRVKISNVNDENKIIKCSCGCLGAGAGKCKHVVAVLYRLCRISQDGLPLISCTDMVQAWGKRAMEKWSKEEFGAVALAKTCHLMPATYTNEPEVTPSFLQKARLKLIEGEPLSALALTMSMERCTGNDDPPPTPHKSVRRALNDARTCPIGLPSPALLGRRGRNSTLSSATGNKENSPAVQPSLEEKTPASNATLASGSLSSSRKPTSDRGVKRKTLSQLDVNTFDGCEPATLKEAAKSRDLKSIWQSLNMLRPEVPLFRAATAEDVRGLIAANSNLLDLYELDALIVFSSADQESARNRYHSSVAVSEEASVSLCLQTTRQSDDSLWSPERRKRITASKCYQLYSAQRSLDDNQYWEKKIEKLISCKFYGTWSTQRGLHDEPFAKKAYERLKAGTALTEQGLFVHPQAPWLGFSADGLVADQKIIVEFKSPDVGIIGPAASVVEELAYIKKDSKGNACLSQRHPFYGQVQLAMALSGFSLCHFVIYASHDDSVFCVDVPFDLPFAKKLITKLTKIYFRYFIPCLQKMSLI